MRGLRHGAGGHWLLSLFCAACGSSLKLNLKFCTRCGAAIEPRPAEERLGEETTGVLAQPHWIIVGLIAVSLIGGALFYALAQPKAEICGQATTTAAAGCADAAAPQMEPPNSGEWVRRVTSNQTMAGTGFYIVLGSFPDANGSAQNVVTNRIKVFMQCSRVKPNQALSHEFEGMRPDYAIVFLGGYHDHQMATEILAWAKKCQADAYMKPARWVGLE
ncbi:MAG: hypothetical protein RIS52_915 [Pseudomonadota bacterium]